MELILFFLEKIKAPINALQARLGFKVSIRCAIRGKRPGGERIFNAKFLRTKPSSRRFTVSLQSLTRGNE